MKTLLFWISLFFSLLGYPLAQAAMNLELTKGTASSIPIAIVPFQSPGKTLSTDLSDVITNDLSHSGEFKTLDIHSMKSQPSDFNEVHFNEWSSQKINYLVIGKIESEGLSRYKITFSLLDVYKGLNQPNDANVVTKTIEVRENTLRTAAHHIADIIYEQITGVKGIFSTKLAYILVQHDETRAPQYDLMISDIDGQNPQTILSSDEPIMSPAWSPDGKKIAYVSLEGRKASVYVSDIASGHRHLISQQSGINGAPAWSPDGTQLALVLSQGQGTVIYTCDASGGHLKQITQGFSIDTEPTWLSDGSAIIFTSDRGGSPQIYRVDTSTHDVHRLTFSGDYNTSASLTPDNNTIVLLHRENGQYNIATMDLGTSIISILSHSGFDQSPKVSPNGKMIVYSSSAGKKSILSFVSIDGRVRLALPEKNGDVREPAWGPLRV